MPRGLIHEHSQVAVVKISRPGATYANIGITLMTGQDDGPAEVRGSHWTRTGRSGPEKQEARHFAVALRHGATSCSAGRAKRLSKRTSNPLDD
jgi:hypothetical protein